MARVGRLAGAILAETAGDYFLVGNLKQPCDFTAAGFETPKEVDALKQPYIKLTPKHEIPMAYPYLVIEFEGEALAHLLAERLIIERNGSVSERLWQLILDPAGQEDIQEYSINARWLAEIPAEIWRIVRDTVLRCL